MTASPAKSSPRAELVERLAHQLGFALVGIAPAEPVEHADYVRGWLDAGHQGDMTFMADRLDERLDPRKLLPGAKAMICVADRYPSDQPSATSDQPSGRIARYAWGDDYHQIIKRRLHDFADELRIKYPDHEFRSCVDTAPVMERPIAHQAGLGWVGKHTLLIHPQLGSWLLLGEIITTLPLQPSAPTPSTIGCGTCTRCIDACPTHCIDPAGYRMDASRCISYLTIEHKGEIDPALHPAMGPWIAGCDVCQEVCPFNNQTLDLPTTSPSRLRFSVFPNQSQPTYTPRPPAPAIPLLDLLQWTETTRRDAFVRSALKRIKLDQLKRNTLIAAGNHLAAVDDPPLRSRIEAIASDANESELVRITATQVLAANQRVG